MHAKHRARYMGFFFSFFLNLGLAFDVEDPIVASPIPPTIIEESDVELVREEENQFFIARLRDIGLIDLDQIYPDVERMEEINMQNQLLLALLIFAFLIILSVGLGLNIKNS